MPSKEFCEENKARIKAFDEANNPPEDVEGTRIFAECQMRKHLSRGGSVPRSVLAILQEEAIINLEEFTELVHAQFQNPADQVRTWGCLLLPVAARYAFCHDHQWLAPNDCRAYV